ncbi:MAG: hypothetical protein EAX96_15600 [Candidatus Lokiarchaeota archaeon]|nr:hypothetical protein [Candidatus Lokiarchaeota archaeon]
MSFKFDEDSLVYISRYFNKNFISLTPIRQKQASKFIRNIRRQALDKLGSWPKLSNKELFYVGSVDFMVTEYDGRRKFVILEANGGSSRGFLSTGTDQIEMIFLAYKNAVDEVIGEEPIRVLIGTLPNDDLFQEKIMLAEFLKQRYEVEGYRVGIYNSFSYLPNKEEEDDLTIIISNYNNLLDVLSYKNQYVAFKDKKIHILIGDGVVRRFPIVGAYIKHDWNQVKTRIINTIYHITDDKANTYLAGMIGKDILEEYRIHPLRFCKVADPFQLENILNDLLKENKHNFVIKPFGGSGGAGIQAIRHNHTIEQAKKIMGNSIKDFYDKFDPRRNPFPYTIQEMAKFSLINFNNTKRTFDIRIYVVQQEGHLFPVGGNGRIARAPYTGEFNKDEFVVNICGDWGVDINRAIAFSPENLKMLELNEEDLVDMFCSACHLFQISSEKHYEILKFKEWNKFIFN